MPGTGGGLRRSSRDVVSAQATAPPPYAKLSRHDAFREENDRNSTSRVRHRGSNPYQDRGSAGRRNNLPSGAGVRRLFAELARSIHSSDPDAVAMDNKLNVYWTKRSEEIGAKAGLTPHTVSVSKPLVIEIKAERFAPVMLACLQATPRKRYADQALGSCSLPSCPAETRAPSEPAATSGSGRAWRPRRLPPPGRGGPPSGLVLQ